MKRGAPGDATPATAAKRHVARQPDRVTLDVGGVLFHTSQDTLTANSAYFCGLFSGAWSSDGEDPQFIDRDPDAFRVLLSCMRNRSIILPKDDLALSARVLLEADFLGVDGL
jgi:hypothetical protein